MPGWNSQDWGDPKIFMTLRIGIYYIFLEEIYKNFPLNQVKNYHNNNNNNNNDNNNTEVNESSFHFIISSSVLAPYLCIGIILSLHISLEDSVVMILLLSSP